MSTIENITAPREDVSLLHGLGNKPFSTGAYSFDMRRTKGPKCVCGCGNSVNRSCDGKQWNKYLKGHWAKDPKGRNQTGWKHTEETKKRLSIANTGTPSPRKGVTLSAETRKKISLGHKGKKLSEEHKRKIGGGTYRKTAEYIAKQRKAHCGKTISDEQKESIQMHMQQAWQNPDFRNMLTGENAFGWKGGLSFESYPPEFNKTLKKRIRERDNHACQNPDCPETSSRLNIHHIDYNKSNCESINLITLCVACNAIANWNRGFWEKVYTTIINEKYVS